MRQPPSDHGRNSARLTTAVAIAALSAWLLFAVGGAFGQAEAPAGPGGGIPCEWAASTQLNAQQTSAIREFVSRNIGKLAEEDRPAREAAREALLMPLTRCTGISLAFRIEYSAALSQGGIVRLATHSDDNLAVSALMIAGHTATDAMVEAIKLGLKDGRPAVRMGAAVASRVMIRDISIEGGQVRRTAAAAVIDACTEALAIEEDALVASGLVVALDSPVSGSDVRLEAILKLSGSLSKQGKGLRAKDLGNDGAAWATALLRGAEAVRRTLIERGGQGSNQELARSAAILSGQALAHALSRLNASDASALAASGEAEALAALVQSAEFTLKFAEGEMSGPGAGGAPALLPAFQSAVQSGDPGPFKAEADRWIAAGGKLTKPPFGATPGDFE